jgi:Rps23 Pro-64 3,4-dihydroxylase Tpa1-like proline 4-hydroxylase
MFLEWLEDMTGIAGLLPDPHMIGGGPHEIRRGGKLAVHADFNRHPHTGLDRRLNVLLYLNREWQQAWGGHLELWDLNRERCKQIAPVFNRLVVFATTSTSWHGHPVPLTCPPGVYRRSIAFYYYTDGRPAHESMGDHSTVFVDTPGA